MRIMLTDQEIQICHYMGKQRRANAMMHNTDQKVSDRDAEKIDIDGFMAEFIVAKKFNVMPDFSIRPFKNPVDLTINKKTVDVKSTRNPEGKMYVNEYHRNNPCDIYIQVVLDDFGGRITGFITAEDLFELAEVKHSVDQFGKEHTSYVLDQSHLKPL